MECPYPDVLHPNPGTNKKKKQKRKLPKNFRNKVSEKRRENNGKQFSSLKLDRNNLDKESNEIINKYNLEDRIKNGEFDKIKYNGIQIETDDGKDLLHTSKVRDDQGNDIEGLYKGGIKVKVNGKEIRIRTIYDDDQNTLKVFIKGDPQVYNKEWKN